MSAQAGHWSDDDIEDLLEDASSDSQVVKQLRAALKAQTRARKEAEQERDGYRTNTRKSTIDNLLKSRELNPKVAAFIPSDVEATEEAIGKWLDEYCDVFGATKQEAPAGQTPATPAGLDEQQIAAMRSMDVMAGKAGTAVPNDLMASLQNATSADAIIALIEAQGGGAGH